MESIRTLRPFFALETLIPEQLATGSFPRPFRRSYQPGLDELGAIAANLSEVYAELLT
jgi:hypothetical protein